MDEKKVREAIADNLGFIKHLKKEVEFLKKEDCRKTLIDTYQGQIDICETIAEALEKQLPKKVISYHNENINREQYRCPVCENLVLTEDITTSLFGTDKEYCDKCGQRLDWSE